jgi:hypothetical protein
MAETSGEVIDSTTGVRAAPVYVNPAFAGGGYNSSMVEARLATLETQIGHVQSDLEKLASIPSDLAALKVTVDNLPTKDYLTGRFDLQFRWIAGLVGIMLTVATLIIKLA